MNKIVYNNNTTNNNSNNNDLDVNNNNRDNIEPIRIVRQYINSAVYVESSIYDMPPFKRSPILLNYYSDDDSSSLHRVVKIKRCVCLINPGNCPCHPYIIQNESKTSLTCKSKRNSQSASPSETSLRSCDTVVSTIKAEDFKISVPSSSALTTCTSQRFDMCSQKEEAFRNWCIKKRKERKRAEDERLKQEEMRQKEREVMLERERENFKRWLEGKKEEEEKRKRQKEEDGETEKAKEMLKEQRKMENELKYRLWLKQKEELFLERKIKEQAEYIKITEERERRVMQCSKAYGEWLKASKYKPKPIPLNQGLQSLKSSVSVTYINPTPWVPNIDSNGEKPSSQ